MTEKTFPSLSNIGKDCIFWKFKTKELKNGEQATSCTYPKAEIMGRTSCEGVIDDVCLYLINGKRRPLSLTEEQIKKLKVTPVSLTNDFSIPPGDTKI